ncbi:MAG: DUF1853 family protein [Bacteroidetes bacterium]|nr:MAG: DUF1853 family protein [Bacteroidota bacterium]
MEETVFQEGLNASHFLWNGDFHGIHQFPEQIPIHISDWSLIRGKRLGIMAEQAIIQSFQKHPDYTFLGANIQINSEQQTLGELDVILKQGERIIHLEICYKFYLYDAKFEHSEIPYWIGPNRKDSLAEKVQKIRDRQFPLIQSPEAQSKLNLPKELQVSQYSYFLAELFTPEQFDISKQHSINNKCIRGHFYRLEELYKFSNDRFHILEKRDWINTPHRQAPWLTYREFMVLAQTSINDRKSLLYWRMDSEQKIHKSFVCWW